MQCVGAKVLPAMRRYLSVSITEMGTLRLVVLWWSMVKHVMRRLWSGLSSQKASRQEQRQHHGLHKSASIHAKKELLIKGAYCKCH